MKCLKIDDKWLRLILAGQKAWEIRRIRTNFRGRIALRNTKTKNYEGYAAIVARVLDQADVPTKEASD